MTTLRASDASGPPSEDLLIRHMTGGGLGASPSQEDRGLNITHPNDRPPVLEVVGLVGGPLRGLDFVVRAGEVVGMTGLVGSGRTTLLKTIFGQHRPAAGRIALDGSEQSGTEDVHTRITAGVPTWPRTGWPSRPSLG